MHYLAMKAIAACLTSTLLMTLIVRGLPRAGPLTGLPLGLDVVWVDLGVVLALAGAAAAAAPLGSVTCVTLTVLVTAASTAVVPDSARPAPSWRAFLAAERCAKADFLGTLAIAGFSSDRVLLRMAASHSVLAAWYSSSAAIASSAWQAKRGGRMHVKQSRTNLVSDMPACAEVGSMQSWARGHIQDHARRSESLYSVYSSSRS